MTKLIKERIKIYYLLFPVIFSVLSSLLYILAYKPELKSKDMTSTFFVFFAALGWSAVIFLGERGFLQSAYVYSAISIVFPILFFEILRILPYDIHWHRIIIAIIIASNLWLIDIYRGKSTLEKSNI